MAIRTLVPNADYKAQIISQSIRGAAFQSYEVFMKQRNKAK